MKEYIPKFTNYSLRIETDLMDRAKKKDRELSIPTSEFIRQYIEEKIENDGRMDKIEERLDNLESKAKGTNNGK